MLRPTVLMCGRSGRDRHRDTLAAAGYNVIEVPTVARAAAQQHAHQADLVVLDAADTSADVHEVCRAVHALGRVPVVVVGAPGDQGRLDDVVQLMAFAAGADDVVSAETTSKVLLARVGRRASAYGLRPPARDAAPRRDRSSSTPRAGTATMAGTQLDLTRIEFDLLAILLEHPTRVVPREELVSRVWGSWFGDDHVVEVHLSRLRAKVVRAGGPRIGVAVRGVGYRLGLGTPVAV